MSTASKEIRKYIALLDKGKIFGSVELQRFGTPAQITRVCKSLELDKQIIRLAYGLFIKGSPEDTLVPNALEIACAKAEINKCFVVGYRHQLWRYGWSRPTDEGCHFLSLGYSGKFQSVCGQIVLHNISASKLTLWSHAQIDAARATGSSKAFLEMTSGKLIGIPAHQAVKLYGKDLDYNYIPGEEDDCDFYCGSCSNPYPHDHSEEDEYYDRIYSGDDGGGFIDEDNIDFTPDDDETTPPNPPLTPVHRANADDEMHPQKANFYTDPEEEQTLICTSACGIMQKTCLHVYH